MMPLHGLRGATALAFAALAAGCASVPPALPGPGAGTVVCSGAALAAEPCASRIAAQQARAEHMRTGQPAWRLNGRAAIKTAERGGNVHVDWQQHGPETYRITLSAPVTRQSWRLDVDRGMATVSGLPDGPLSGPDAAKLLLHATGWQLPLEPLRAWLMGLPAAAPPARAYMFDGDAASSGLVGLEQDGWRIRFQHDDGQSLPRRIDAESDDGRASVRLIVESREPVRHD